MLLSCKLIDSFRFIIKLRVILGFGSCLITLLSQYALAQPARIQATIPAVNQSGASASSMTVQAISSNGLATDPSAVVTAIPVDQSVLGFNCAGLAKSPCPVDVLAALKAAGVGLDDVAFAAQAVDANAPVWFAHRADQRVVLASTTKVVTALAAIETLGVKYRWRTRAFLLGDLVDGVLTGDLLIAGGGDASLNSTQLHKWFMQMQAKGLKEIRGNILIDRQGFRMQDADAANTPQESAENPHHRWPDALVVNEGIITVELSHKNGALSVVTDPPLDDASMQVQINTQSGCQAQIKLVNDAGTSKVSINGTWAARCGSKKFELVTDHNESMIHAIVAGTWRSSGGMLSGQVLTRTHLAPKTGRKNAPFTWNLPKKPWSVHESAPLATIIKEMNKTSNNIYARHLMLSLSKDFPNQSASVSNAKVRSVSWLKKLGIAKDDIHLDNGAGLSRTEKAKPLAMLTLLRKGYSSKNSKILLDSLPIAGQDGTLARRMKGSAAQGNAFLKSGSLTDTRALAGFVKSKSGKVYAVVAIINHPKADRAVPALDGFIEWIVRFG